MLGLEGEQVNESVEVDCALSSQLLENRHFAQNPTLQLKACKGLLTTVDYRFARHPAATT